MTGRWPTVRTDPVVGRGDLARERGPARHRPGAVHRRPGRTGTTACCTPGRSRPRTPTPGSPACAPSPRYDVPGVVRVLTADDVPGRERRRREARRAAVPDRGHVLRARRLLGARRDAGGGPAGADGRRGRLRAAAGAGHVARGDRGGELPGRQPAPCSRGDAEAALGRRAHRLRAASSSSAARSTSTWRPTPRWRWSTRTARSSSSPARSTRRETQEIVAHVLGLPSPRGHRAVPADGRRLRRQGDAAARPAPRSPRSAPRSPGARWACG